MRSEPLVTPGLAKHCCQVAIHGTCFTEGVLWLKSDASDFVNAQQLQMLPSFSVQGNVPSYATVTL